MIMNVFKSTPVQLIMALSKHINLAIEGLGTGISNCLITMRSAMKSLDAEYLCAFHQQCILACSYTSVIDVYMHAAEYTYTRDPSHKLTGKT